MYAEIDAGLVLNTSGVILPEIWSEKYQETITWCF